MPRHTSNPSLAGSGSICGRFCPQKEKGNLTAALSVLCIHKQCRRSSGAETPHNEEYSKQHERDAQKLSHIEGHPLLKAHLVLLHKLYEEPGEEYSYEEFDQLWKKAKSLTE